MGYQDKKSECVGCDAKTEGTIREEFNWHLCDECYEQALLDRDDDDYVESDDPYIPCIHEDQFSE